MIYVVLSTFPTEEAATSTIRSLLDEHLIACGTILPSARSLYHWKGKIEEAAEALVIFKMPVDRYSEFETRLRALHPYEVPEIISLTPSSVGESYSRWISDSCAS